MFSLILKNMGHKSTMRPLMLQTRNFKREVTNDDLNKSDFLKKFEGQPDIFGKELFFPKYGNSMYDESIKENYHKNNFDVENEKWCDDDDKVYTDRED